MFRRYEEEIRSSSSQSVLSLLIIFLHFYLLLQYRRFLFDLDTDDVFRLLIMIIHSLERINRNCLIRSNNAALKEYWSSF